MKITAITVCVNYSDFLEHSIEANKDIFDRWIIVTDSKDKATQDLCFINNLEYIVTDVFYKDGGKFRKYAAINEALKKVGDDEWILFLDGDIVLSQWTRRVLANINLDKNKIYGIDRLDCLGYDRYQEYLSNPNLIIDNWLMTNTGLPFASRIVHIYGEWGDEGRFTGYKPLGFFQLCHSSRITIYPEGSKDASHGDIAFAKLWDRKHRELIPEIMGIHLISGGHKGSNWQGRKTKKFESEKNKVEVLSTWSKLKLALINYTFMFKIITGL